MTLKTLILLSASVVTAGATPILFTETVNTSGTLNGTPFIGKLVTITMNTNTSLIVNQGGGIFTITAPATVTVAGVGSDSFTDQIQVVDNQGLNTAGFGDVTQNLPLLYTFNAAFNSYALNGAIGPLTGGASSSVTTFGTAGGGLVLNGPFNVDHLATFTATTTPEPAGSFLMFSGIGALWLVLRRGTRRAG